jgi:hypothetical protein
LKAVLQVVDSKGEQFPQALGKLEPLREAVRFAIAAAPGRAKEKGMSQIDELQRRITAAMDRIGQGLDGLSGVPADEHGSELEALKQEMEDEKLANAQLLERVKRLKRKLNDDRSNRATQMEAQTATAAKLDTELGRLRKANEQLRISNQALRTANEAGVAEPHLINKAMLAELESLRAIRAAEAAETQSIMGTLAPLIDAAAQSEQEDA